MDCDGLIEVAVAACLRSTGVEFRVEQCGEPNNVRFVSIDGLLLVVKVRRTVDRTATVVQMSDDLRVLQAEHAASGALLVTDYLSADTMEQCRAHQVNAIDAAGNVFVSFGTMLLLVSGRARQLQRERVGWSSSAIRIGLVALASPQHLGGTQRDLATCAGVALGSVRSGLDWLEERGFVIRTNAGLVVHQRQQLLNEWEVAYAALARPKLDSERYSTGLDASPDWKSVDIGPGLWSADIGAQQLVGTVKPVNAQLYVRIDQRSPLRRRLFREQHLRNDPDGPIEILNKFWDLPEKDKLGIAPWPIIYADLLRTGDARAVEVAALIRKRFEND
jgi:hypothetical protein